MKRRRVSGAQISTNATPLMKAKFDMGNAKSGNREKFSSVYTLGKQIGQEGAFGKAFLCTNKKTKEVCVAKQILKGPSVNEAEVLEEFSFLSTLRHEGIVEPRGFYQDSKRLYIVMQACMGGELFDRIVEKAKSRKDRNAKGAYSEAECAAIIRKIFQALQYMHERKVGHFDLKPDNFLFLTEREDSPIKIIDFGMSKVVKRGSTINNLAGTMDYMAPEVMDDQGSGYSVHADCWSMGAVTFVMLFGFTPFQGRAENPPIPHRPSPSGGLNANECKCYDCSLCARVKNTGFRPIIREGQGAWFPSSIPVSANARDFIAGLLNSDVATRMSAEEALAHPWLNGEADTNPLVADVLVKLTNLSANNRLKAHLLDVLSSSDCLSNAELERLKKDFADMDLNGDGKISLDEIKVLQTKNPKLASGVQDLMMLTDTNGDQQLDFQEVLIAATQRKLVAKEERSVRSS